MTSQTLILFIYLVFFIEIVNQTSDKNVLLFDSPVEEHKFTAMKESSYLY